jgi:hypothetical protein
MVLALSSFKVSNGLEDSVVCALLNLPRIGPNEAHLGSHKGTMKGLRLDPAFTKLLILESRCA